MKIVALFIAILVACGGSVSAQEGKVEVPTTKINYSLAVPAAVRKQMPRESISRFFGISPLKYEGQEVLIHLYDVKPTDFSPNRASYGVKDYAPNERAYQSFPLHKVPHQSEEDGRPTDYHGVQTCAFDLFLQRDKTHLRRIQSVRFNYVRFVSKVSPLAETVGVNLTWLDPKTKGVPIFNVNLQVKGPIVMSGVNMLIVFPMGLVKKPVVEGFNYGADTATYHWGFGTPDDKGFSTINSDLTARSVNTFTHLQWNGQSWVPMKQTKTKWNGESWIPTQ